MTGTKGIAPKPVILDMMEYCIYGTGNPAWGDPGDVCTKQFSRHLVWLCRKKSVTAEEAAKQLHVPAVYAQKELESLRKAPKNSIGANGCRMTMERLKCIGLMERCSPWRKMYQSLLGVLERLSRRYLADIWRSKER